MKKPMPTVLVVAGLGLAAFGSYAYVNRDAEFSGPRPRMADPTQAQHYSHWVCPQGYQVSTTHTFWDGTVVYCNRVAYTDEEMEEYEGSMVPKGGAPAP